MALKFIDVSLLETDLEVDNMACGRRTNSRPFPGHRMGFFYSVRRTKSKRRCSSKDSKESYEPNRGQHLELTEKKAPTWDEG
jgi:hypothetical protein